MKKYGKIIIAFFALFGLIFAKNYILFDHEPFDDLKVGEIESAYITCDNEQGHVEISDYSSLAEQLKKLKLIKKTNEIPNEYSGAAKVSIYYRDGHSEIIYITADYIHTDKGIFICDKEKSIEFLKYAFRLTLFDRSSIEKADSHLLDELINLALQGKNWNEIRNYAKDKLLTDGFDEDILRNFANQGYSPIYIYVLKRGHRNDLVNHTMDSILETQSKLLVEQIWLDYKEGNITYRFPYTEPPADFVFADIFNDIQDWDNMEFQQNEYGYSFVTIPSADHKYNMTILIDKASYTYNGVKVSYTPPKFRYVTFSFGSAASIPADYPAVDVIKSNNALASTDILTDRITFCMDISSIPEKPKFNKDMFICLLNNIEQQDFCYYNIFPLMPDRNNRQFKISNMEKVIHQVFGDYKWDAKEDFYKDTNFNEKTQSYEFSTDFGWGVLFYSAHNITSSFSADNNQVYSDFDMNGPDKSVTTDPAHKSYGRYRAIYDVVTENNETFLRFNRYEKI